MRHIITFENVSLSQIKQIINRIIDICVTVNNISHAYNQHTQSYSLIIIYQSDIELADDFFDSIVERKEN